MTGEEFDALLDARNKAREEHEAFCAEQNERGASGWQTIGTGDFATKLHRRYLELQEQVDAELARERGEA